MSGTSGGSRRIDAAKEEEAQSARITGAYLDTAERAFNRKALLIEDRRPSWRRERGAHQDQRTEPSCRGHGSMTARPDAVWPGGLQVGQGRPLTL